MNELYNHPYWLKRVWVRELPEANLVKAHHVLERLQETGVESPGVFMGDEEEHELIRFEWINFNSHSVLAFLENETLTFFSLNIDTKEVKNVDSNLDLDGTISFLKRTYPHS